MQEASRFDGGGRPIKVDRRVYTDPSIFEQEMSRIFARTWIYIGHESQVRRHGDFFVSRIGRSQIIVIRDREEVRAFHNRCPHRGAQLCVEPSGSSKRLVCPYHAWTFGTDGQLLGVPHVAGYDDFAGRRAVLGLEPIPRLAAYRGFIFGSLSADGPTLENYLGPYVQAAFDNFVDRAPDGTLDLVGGRLVQNFRANWKLQLENSIDLVHPPILHHNVVNVSERYAAELGPGRSLPPAIDVARSNGLSFEQWDRIRVYALEHGHSYMGTFFQRDEAALLSDEERFGSDDQLQFAGQSEYIRRMVDAYGPVRAREILSFSRHNTIVYPNLFINPRIQQIRLLIPKSVSETEQHCFVFRLNGAPEEALRIAVSFLNASNSASSLATTDDHEIFERVQKGLENGMIDSVDFSRSVDRDQPSDEGREAPGTSELPMRHQHAAWASYMSEVAA